MNKAPPSRCTRAAETPLSTGRGPPGGRPHLTVMAVPPITPRAISRAWGAVRPNSGTPPARQESDVTSVLTSARTTTISNTGMWPCGAGGAGAPVSGTIAAKSGEHTTDNIDQPAVVM